MADKHTSNETPLPEFTPELRGFRTEEFMSLTETLLAIPVEQDQALLDAAPFRLDAPDAQAEDPMQALPPRWYPRPAPDVIEVARASLVPPPRPPVFEGRASELERVLRPLLSGHSVGVQGEPGSGKTTLLTAVAAHERTRQRFRRIWWIDEPARLDQTLALALNLPHILVEPDAKARRAMLAEHLDDHTLLIIDSAAPHGLDLAVLRALTPHVLIAIDTEPEILDPDEPLPDDPEGMVTLRALDETAAIDVLAHYAGIHDTRRIRGDLMRVAQLLGNHPLALLLAGKLMSSDGLALADLEDVLALDEDESGNEDDEASEDEDSEAADVEARMASLNRALDVSVAALPGDYQRLFMAFGAFPPEGAPFDGLHAAARIGTRLATRRGLIMLAQYGFVRVDHRDPDRFIMHPVAYDHASHPDAHDSRNTLGKRMRAWAQRYAKEHAGDPLALYHAEASLVYANKMMGPQRNSPVLDAMRAYLREYAPGMVPGDYTPDPSELTGPRAEGMRLTNYGIELTDQGAYYAAEEALKRALELRKAHDSPHAIAETLVAQARLYDQSKRFGEALQALIDAAEMVYNLGAESSVSVIRRGMARVYRHMGRLSDALDVLDESTDAHLERAAVLRAQGHYTAAVSEMTQAGDATPYARAEMFLLAGQYAEALDAIAGQDDPASAHLRAQAYHLQGRVDEAMRGYEAALEHYSEDDPARAKTLRGLGGALAIGGRYDEARAALQEALDLLNHQGKPNPTHLGRTLRLLAAVHLVAGDETQAIATAREAIEQLDQTHAPEDAADAYRTLGRALWRTGDHDGALEAFKGEVEFAQSMSPRDEPRIGVALHHLGDAYRATGSGDRAVGNYRRALNHKNAAGDPLGYFITQLALYRALMEQGRFPAALELSQEMLDHLSQSMPFDMARFGYLQVLRARTQQAMERPIRAGQSLGEWLRQLATRADEAAADERPTIRVLVLGLAARSLLADERPALALRVAEREMAIAEDSFPGTLAAWAARRDVGEAHMALEQVEDAILTLEPLLADAVRDEPATYALAQAITGHGYRALDDLEEALIHLRTALESEPDTHLKALLQEAIGNIELDLGRPNDAVESLQAALPLIDQAAHPDVAARVLTTLAHTLGGLNRYAEAIGVYEEALAALRDVADVSPTHTADVLRSLGQTHEAQGQLSEAALVYRRALNVLERVDSPRQARDILYLLARVTAAMGDQSAVHLYEQARDQTREWGTTRELGEVLAELGDVHRDAGRLTPAIQNYQAALDYLPADEHPRERVNALRNLGRAYAQMERYDEARGAWTEALDLSRDLPNRSPQEIALTHHAIAEAHRVQEHYAEAEAAYRQALEFHTPKTVEIAATWRALGLALHAAGRDDEAVEPLTRALEAEKAQPQQSNARLVNTLQLMAEVHEEREDLNAAIARHHETLVYMDRNLQPVAYATTLRTLGMLYREIEQFDQAHIALKEALEIEGLHAPRSDERISATLQSIADTYRAEGDLEKAAEYYQKVTVYANLARRASQDLRATLDELDRRRATLQAAQQSLALFDRSGDSDLKDLAFIYALIARSQAGLNQPRQSADTITELLDVLESHRASLDTDASQPDQRALAWLAEVGPAQDADDIDTARTACQSALDCVQNANLHWVIRQVALSLD